MTLGYLDELRVNMGRLMDQLEEEIRELRPYEVHSRESANQALLQEAGDLKRRLAEPLEPESLRQLDQDFSALTGRVMRHRLVVRLRSAGLNRR